VRIKDKDSEESRYYIGTPFFYKYPIKNNQYLKKYSNNLIPKTAKSRHTILFIKIFNYCFKYWLFDIGYLF
jgi:hypothetical protein